MINERARHIWRPIWAITGLLRAHCRPRRERWGNHGCVDGNHHRGWRFADRHCDIANPESPTGDDRIAALDRTAASMLVATTAEAIFLAGAMAVMAGPALPPVLTLPGKATAVEEAATAVVVEAISGRRCLSGPVSPLSYSRSFFRFIPV